jgi:hypothetical protein
VKEIPRRAGHSLTKEEEQRLREVAFSRPKWQTAAHCIVLTLNTTLGFGEVRAANEDRRERPFLSQRLLSPWGEFSILRWWAFRSFIKVKREVGE